MTNGIEQTADAVEVERIHNLDRGVTRSQECEVDVGVVAAIRVVERRVVRMERMERRSRATQRKIRNALQP